MEEKKKKIFKSKMKKFIIMAVIAIIVNFVFLGEGLTESLQIMDNLDYNITVNQDGSMTIVETWDIYISKTNTIFKNFDKSNKFGEIKDVKVKDLQTGKNLTKIYEEMYHVTDNCYYALDISGGKFEIAWGTGMENETGKKKYQITYTITDVITDYKDCQELYWQLLSESNAIPVKKVTGTINLPEGATESSLKAWGHGPLNGNIKIASNNCVKFDIDDLSSGKMLEIRVVTPNKICNVNSSNKIKEYNYLSNIINEETKWAEEANNLSKGWKIFFSIVVVIYILIVINIIRKIIKFNKIRKKKNDGIRHLNLEYFRDIPREDEATPGEAQYLYYFTKSKDDCLGYQADLVAATILNLTLKKYISLRCEENNKVYIKILKDDDGLKEDEATVYKLLKKAGSSNEEFEISKLNQFAKNKYSEYSVIINKLINSSRENLYKLKFVNKAEQKDYKKSQQASGKYTILVGLVEYIIISILISMIPIFNRLYMILFGTGYLTTILKLGIFFAPIIILKLIQYKIQSQVQTKIAVLTQEGSEEKEKWVALAKFLKEYSLLNEKDVPSLVIWEKYLVYATAFGIAEKVIEQMKAIYPEVFVEEYWEDEAKAQEYSVLRFSVYNNDIYYHSETGFISSIESLRSSANKAYNTSVTEIARHSSSSGSGGGGGFSGGGRRPEAAVAGMGGR